MMPTTTVVLTYDSTALAASAEESTVADGYLPN
jgi:hypothetical protein